MSGRRMTMQQDNGLRDAMALYAMFNQQQQQQQGSEDDLLKMLIGMQQAEKQQGLMAEQAQSLAKYRTGTLAAQQQERYEPTVFDQLASTDPTGASAARYKSRLLPDEYEAGANAAWQGLVQEADKGRLPEQFHPDVLKMWQQATGTGVQENWFPGETALPPPVPVVTPAPSTQLTAAGQAGEQFRKAYLGPAVKGTVKTLTDFGPGLVNVGNQGLEAAAGLFGMPLNLGRLPSPVDSMPTKDDLSWLWSTFTNSQQ
jgi:hypothetical protein